MASPSQSTTSRLEFRRQHLVDRYMIDFYCPEARLAIEIDGGATISSKLAARRALTSTADGKKIHSARLSGRRKLVPGSHWQSHIGPAIAVTPKDRS
jgi:hypothetical protein